MQSSLPLFLHIWLHGIISTFGATIRTSRQPPVITGYAKSKADALTQAGYTSVTPSNPTGNVPSQTVVWYQNEADKATAENVAQTLGISNVQQSSGLVTPIVVVLLN